MYADSSIGWRSSGAAEYPEGLCKCLAKAYVDCSDSLKPPYTMIDDMGTHSLGEAETKRQRRAAENVAATGGMRTPHLSLAKVPGWDQWANASGRCSAEYSTSLQRTSRQT